MKRQLSLLSLGFGGGSTPSDQLLILLSVVKAEHLRHGLRVLAHQSL